MKSSVIVCLVLKCKFLVMLRSVNKWSVFWIFQDLDLGELQCRSPQGLVSDSLLNVKGLFLLEDLPLPEFHANLKFICT